MELTLAEIWKTRESWQSVMRLQVKAKTALQLMRLNQALEPEIKTIAKVQDDLILKHGDGKGKISLAMEGWPKFLAEMNEALEQTIIIADFPVIVLPDTVEIDAASLIALERFVKVEEK